MNEKSMNKGIDVTVQHLKSESTHSKSSNRIVTCFVCDESMEIQDSTILYDSKWFHNMCWEKSDKYNL